MGKVAPVRVSGKKAPAPSKKDEEKQKHGKAQCNTLTQLNNAQKKRQALEDKKQSGEEVDPQEVEALNCKVNFLQAQRTSKRLT